MANNQIQYSGIVFDDYFAGLQNAPLIMSLSINIGDSLTSDTLSVDTMTCVLRSPDKRLDLSFQYGEEIIFNRNGQLVAKFYAENITRTGAQEYQLSCVSAIGLLLADYNYGGVYNGEPFREVLEYIVGDAFNYSVDADIVNIEIFGFLPKSTRRENLQSLLFATGVQVRKDSAGNVTFSKIDTQTTKNISIDRVYVGGSVAGNTPATRVDVVEYAYVPPLDDTQIILYNGEAAGSTITTPKGATVKGVLIDFPEPMYSVSAENTSIFELGANYAVISSSHFATITGRKWARTERIVSRKAKTTAKQENVVQSSKCGLVNLFNSEMVAERLMNYYGGGTVINSDFVYNGEKSGDNVSLKNAFLEDTEGFITEMSLNISNTIKASAKIVTGYMPTEYGNYYKNVQIVMTSGKITVPVGCKGKMRIVAVGGGMGGYAGHNGEDGTRGESSRRGESGKGGTGGKGGDGGRIYVETVDVMAGDVINITIGTGGDGGYITKSATSGALLEYAPKDGTPTIVSANGWEIRSDYGYSSENGFSALMTDNVYAMRGYSGINGGSGYDEDKAATEQETVIYKGTTYRVGANGANSETIGGHTGYGGLGGGAAAGANGKDGTKGIAVKQSDEDTPYYAEAGNGGNGADAASGSIGTYRGQGGQGGHGGGGGGGGGTAKGSNSWAYGSGGKGGIGGVGGKGADGIVILYY